MLLLTFQNKGDKVLAEHKLPSDSEIKTLHNHSAKDLYLKNHMDPSLGTWGTKDQLLFPELLHSDLKENRARAFPKVPFVVAVSRVSHGSSVDCSVPLGSGFPWKTARATGWWESLTSCLEPSGSKEQSQSAAPLIKGNHLKHKPKPYSLWVS